MKFTTYKIGTATGKGGWFWQVTNEVGPAVLVVARSGYAYATEEGAISGYKEFVKWASMPPASTPPPATV